MAKITVLLAEDHKIVRQSIRQFLEREPDIENARLRQQQLVITNQLRQSEDHYRQLFEGAHDAIWIHDLEGNILSANKATERLTGYSLDELSRLNVRDFLSADGLKVAREIGRDLMQGQVVFQPYEQRMIRRDGTEATLMLTTNLIRQDGQPRGFQNIARDITDRKSVV